MTNRWKLIAIASCILNVFAIGVVGWEQTSRPAEKPKYEPVCAVDPAVPEYRAFLVHEQGKLACLFVKIDKKNKLFLTDLPSN